MEEKESKVQKVKQYIINNKALVTIITCLVIFILAMGGAVSSAINERELMSDQLQGQTEQYEELQRDFDTLSIQYDDLTGDYDALQVELENYQDQQDAIDNLNAQLTELQEKYDTISAENEKLKSEKEELKSQVSSLRAKASSTSQSPGSYGSGDDSGGGMVWLSATGSKYHSIPDCGNMNPNNARQVSRSSAEAQGYDACSKCW